MRLEGVQFPTHSAAPPAESGAGQAVQRPRASGLLAWLCDERVASEDGKVLSWHNPAHPGFPYPEASALWLSWAAWRREEGLAGPTPDQVWRVASRLEVTLADNDPVGKQGSDYLFDRCLALHGLARVAQSLAADPGQGRPLSRHAAGLERFLQRDTVVLPKAHGERWSHRWNVHLLRAGALLLQAGQWRRDATIGALARRVLERTRRDLGEGSPYLHAQLYQAEGLLLLGALGQGSGSRMPLALAALLAKLQRPNGLLPSWEDGSGPLRSDTTAQAVRLWTLVDSAAYAGPVARALAALTRQQRPEGGVVYELGSHDVNCWATLFTDQARHWAQHGADPLALI